jgi:tetratricopeptide (TPR) repeat protein
MGLGEIREARADVVGMLYPSRKYRLERRAARAFGLKDYASAIRTLEELLHLVGENPNTLHVLAICRQRLGQHGSAIVAAERGISADPKHLSCLKVLAEFHAASGDLKTARGYALRALAIIEADTRAPGMFAAVIRRMGGPGFQAMGTSAEDREWARWARALCESAVDTVK